MIKNFQQIISRQSKSSTQIIDLTASNQSKVALIQKTSNLTNIQYSHHHHNYDYCRIQYRHQNYEFHYNNLQTKQFFLLTSHHSHTSSTYPVKIYKILVILGHYPTSHNLKPKQITNSNVTIIYSTIYHLEPKQIIISNVIIILQNNLRIPVYKHYGKNASL